MEEQARDCDGHTSEQEIQPVEQKCRSSGPAGSCDLGVRVEERVVGGPGDEEGRADAVGGDAAQHVGSAGEVVQVDEESTHEDEGAEQEQPRGTSLPRAGLRALLGHWIR
mgnify:CR=1 FL=1